MSVHKYVYVGPYAKIEAKKTEETIDICASHNRLDSAKFCSVCGKANRYETHVNCPNIYDLPFVKDGEDDEICNHLTPVLNDDTEKTSVSILIPNRHRDKFGSPDLEEGGYGHFMVDYTTEVNTFHEIFADEITCLETVFSVEVDYGYVVYYM